MKRTISKRLVTLLTATVLCLTGLAVMPTANSITVTSGALQMMVSLPDSLVLHEVESDVVVRVYEEQRHFKLCSDLYVDILAPPDKTYSLPSHLIPGVIPKCGFVNSYLVHADKIGSTIELIDLSGSVTFNTEILGIIVTSSTLDSSDDILGCSSTAYEPRYINGADQLSGLELNGQDWIIVNGKTVEIYFGFAEKMDEIRIITAPCRYGLMAQEYGALLQMWAAAPNNLIVYENPNCPETGEMWTYNRADFVEVPAIQTTPTESNIILEDGVNYILRAAGIAFAGDHIYFDAKYSITTDVDYDPWTDMVTRYEWVGPQLLDLQVDGVSVDWGDYNEFHLYHTSITGDGTTIELLINDIYYPNNDGSLFVWIYKQI